MSDPLPALFLDIDGGLLVRRAHSGLLDAFEPAPGCLEFLEWATALFECRWLSTRCRPGWPDGSQRAFRLAGAPLEHARWRVLDLIEPAAWSARKVEALDPASDSWWWLDDDPTESDREWLRAHGRLERLLVVCINTDPDALSKARSRLSDWRAD